VSEAFLEAQIWLGFLEAEDTLSNSAEAGILSVSKSAAMGAWLLNSTDPLCLKFKAPNPKLSTALFFLTITDSTISSRTPERML